MIYLANSREMKSIDTYSIETLGIPSAVLMERAAYATAVRICEVLKDTEGKKVIAVCGSRNNGGDGLAVVRILTTMGVSSAWYMAGDTAKATKETALQIKILENMKVPRCRSLDELTQADLIVDAIFGIGLTRPVEGNFARTVEAINRCRAIGRAAVCAVDIPSGISTDTGQVLGCAVEADFTVTFGTLKTGLVLYPGACHSGQVFVENIGFPIEATDQARIHTFAFEKEDIVRYLPKRQAYSNKGSYGRVLVIAGSKNMAGACFFSARAAYNCGCGLVRVFTVQENHDVILEKLPEAVLTTYDSTLVDMDLLDQAIEWADSVVLGPGLTCAPYAVNIVAYTLKHCKVPLVIDADGLNIIAGNGSLWDSVPQNTVFTPHLGEMSRLSSMPVGQMCLDLPKTCREFAKNHGIICVLKDARTIVSDGANCFINLSGNDGMATGGSGDVLSGIIGGFLAQKMDPLTAAAFGCFVHGLAGDAARKEKGAYGLLASDIIQYMSKIIR